MLKRVKTFVLLILMVTFACSESVPPVYAYLALGDSYTIGQSVEEAERWPVQLSAALNNTGINLGAPKIIARTGWRTDQLLDSIQSDPNTKTNYELVSLLIGVNNQFQRRSVESFAPEFEELLQTAIRLAGNDKKKVIVLSIPDYGKVPFYRTRGGEAIGQEIDRFNAASKTICEQYGVRYFDITPLSREVENDSELISEDLLHPSGKMYARWVNLVLDDVFDLLNDQ
ncbi:MAG: lysophospholipase L1-like esterase [Roseivirga sp.]|jgi:lysophospholipase L1-like esterase